MKAIILHLPDPLKAKLNGLRAQGYSMNGFIRALLERELAGKMPNKKRKAAR